MVMNLNSILSIFIVACSAISQNQNTLINNALKHITKSSNYTIIDTGNLLKNSSGSSTGNPGGGYGHFQFDNNTIKTAQIWAQVNNEFLISSNDAVIFIGKTPPSCKYFSYSLYLCEQLLYSKNNNSRIELFASLIPTLNHLLINTSAVYSNNVFNQTLIIIFTASKQTYSDLYEIFASYNLSSMINLQPIVSDYVNLTDYNISALNVVLRVALPNNLTTFIEFMAMNQTIYYVSSNEISNNVSDKYLSNNWKENTYSNLNVNETDKYSSLFSEYQHDIISYLQSSPYNMTFEGFYDFFSPYFPNNESYMGNYGWDCINKNANCKIDNRDCYYSVNDNAEYPMLYDDKIFWLIIGVNHFITNQTTYSLFALWEGNTNNLHVNSYDVNNFEYGNKQLLYNETNQKYSMLFSVQFTRKENCLSNVAGFCVDYDKEAPLYLILGRDYLNPITKTRPNESELIKHVLMKFRLP
eukprot:182138_1